jgi:serine/threonine-protein kinase HipA
LPLYDLTPVRLDRRYTHQLACNLGAATDFGEMSADDLAAVFDAFGVEDVAVVAPPRSRRPRRPRLGGTGLRLLDDLIGRETERLVELLSIALTVRERDFSPYETGGGWAGS